MRGGICYFITCSRQPCREIEEDQEDRQMDLTIPMARYAGESSRTPYTRGARHLALYTGSQAEREKSFMWKHCVDMHGGVYGEEGGVRDFKMEVVSVHKEPLSRVLREALEIQQLENMKIGWKSLDRDGRKVSCLNSKQEYYQNVIPRNIQITGNLREG